MTENERTLNASDQGLLKEIDKALDLAMDCVRAGVDLDTEMGVIEVPEDDYEDD